MTLATVWRRDGVRLGGKRQNVYMEMIAIQGGGGSWTIASMGETGRSGPI